MRESTSFRWIVSLLQRTFGMETKGEHFLALEDAKLEYGPDFTPQQGFMAIKDIVCAGLLEEGSKYEGRELTERELLTPTVKFHNKRVVAQERRKASKACKRDKRAPVHHGKTNPALQPADFC